MTIGSELAGPLMPATMVSIQFRVIPRTLVTGPDCCSTWEREVILKRSFSLTVAALQWLKVARRVDSMLLEFTKPTFV